MREIKFRCWDKCNKEMLEVQELNYTYSYKYKPMIKTTMYNDYFDTEDMIPMQYTGLKDKNGKEIYEGDIVRKLIWNEFKFDKNADGKDYDHAKIIWIEELASYQLVNKENKILWDLADDKYNIEVIGNIYENPELLGGNEQC